MSYTTATRLLPATSEHIQAAAQVIQAGGLVAFPTETVYGLGANAYDAEAVAKIFSAKGRPATNPLIVHIHDMAQLDDLVLEAAPKARQLAMEFWPGPLTLIFNKSVRVPEAVSAGLPTVAIRMPDHPTALDLLRAAGVPICAPSANRSSRPSPTTAAHVRHDLDGHVDIILDGGPTSIGLESTIVNMMSQPPRLLRPGGIPADTLQAHLADLDSTRHKHIDENKAATAPGALLRHYAPDAPVWFVKDIPPQGTILARIRAHLAQKERVGLLGSQSCLAAFADLPCHQETLPDDLEAQAQALFAALRRLDALALDVIYVFPPSSDQGLSLTIRDRLWRAASGKVL